MRSRPPEEATCPICGRHFDPSETRGWCPNPSCGEWQHPSFPLEGATGERQTGPPSHPSGETQKSNQNPAETEPDPDDGTLEECPDCGADLSGIPSDRLATCPICLFDLTPFVEEGDAAGTAPSAASSSEPEPAGETEPATDEPDPAAAPVESIDTVTPGYVRRLTDAGITTVGDLVGTTPDTLSARTGVSTRRIREWIDAAPIDPDDVADETDAVPGASGQSGRSGGADSSSAPDRSGAVERSPADATAPDTHSEKETAPPSREQKPSDFDMQETRIQPPSRSLVFEVGTREIAVADGDAVGAEIRNAMVEAGGSEEEAVYIHRKHVRVDRKRDEFFVTRLGENSLTINGQSVEKGEQARVEDGDEVRFSDVVTTRISIR